MNLLPFGRLRLRLKRSGRKFITLSIGHSGGKGSSWIKILSPLAKPLFEWNHKVVMSWGAESLAKRFGVRVFEE